jgi:hypothetical protein
VLPKPGEVPAETITYFSEYVPFLTSVGFAPAISAVLHHPSGIVRLYLKLWINRHERIAATAAATWVKKPHGLQAGPRLFGFTTRFSERGG